MEEKVVPLPAQFGSFVVPAARAISATSNFVGVTFRFVGRVTSILDSDEGVFSIAERFSVGDPVTGSITYDDEIAASGQKAPRGVYRNAPAAELTIGSSFTESLPFAQSLPGLEMVVQKDTGGHSLNFESDFSLVKSPIFPTNVEAAMVISLTYSAGGAFLNDSPSSSFALDAFDDTHFLITFFDTASGHVSFLEVQLERFTAERTGQSTDKEPHPQARRSGGELSEPIPQERRLSMRRVQPDRRSNLRWYPNGGDRRHQPGRRSEDMKGTMKAVLTGLFSAQAGSGKTVRRQRNV